MKTVEVSGRTLEEALQMAAQELNVSTDALEYEIVSEGTKGFLGLGQLPTVVKAWPKEGAEHVAPEREEPEAKVEVDLPEELEVEEPEELQVVESKVTETPTGDSQAFVDELMRILDEILKAMDVDARPVLKSVDDEEVQVDLVGRDVAILIGKRGQTLDALQYVVAIAANKTCKTKRRVILDAENYRSRQIDILERKALEYARAVKKEGKEAVLEPQSARDRRIVHMALADHPDVYTYSEGEGEDRHVVISPKK